MIKYSYSINVICSICGEQIQANSPIIVLPSNIKIGLLEMMEDVDDNDDSWTQTSSWTPLKTSIGKPFINYAVPGENLLYRGVNWIKAIVFPSTYSKEIQEQLVDLTSKVSNCEAHLECYEKNLHKINQIFNMKSFV
jgi:hypothetical protein